MSESATDKQAQNGYAKMGDDLSNENQYYNLADSVKLAKSLKLETPLKPKPSGKSEWSQSATKKNVTNNKQAHVKPTISTKPTSTTSSTVFASAPSDEGEMDDIYDVAVPDDLSKIQQPQRFQPNSIGDNSIQPGGNAVSKPTKSQKKTMSGTKPAEEYSQVGQTQAGGDYDYAYSHVRASGPITVKDGVDASGSGAAYAEIEDPKKSKKSMKPKAEEDETVMTENTEYMGV